MLGWSEILKYLLALPAQLLKKWKSEIIDFHVYKVLFEGSQCLYRFFFYKKEVELLDSTLILSYCSACFVQQTCPAVLLGKSIFSEG